MSKPTKEEIIAKMEEETQANIAAARPVLENNLFKFNRFVLEVEKGDGRSKLAPVHKEICEYVDKNKQRKKLLLIPRGHLKSTIVTVGYTLQRIVKDPSSRIMIANATHGLACSFLKDVKRELKFNKQIQMFWGDLTEGAVAWNNDSITLKYAKSKEPTVTAKGVDSNMTSQHYDVIIMDDVVNADFVNTQDQIQKTIDFYKECLNLLEPDGELIIIGTRWHDSDLYGWVMDPENNVYQDFDIFLRKAFEGSLDSDEEFSVLFPGKFDRKHLKKLYEQQGPYVFSTQYMNDPIPDVDATFRRDWFQEYDPQELKGRLLNKFVTIDPALSIDKDADYTAIITVGMDEFRNIYILDIVRERLNPNQLINTVFAKWRQFNPITIGIEDVAFQKSLQYALNEEMKNRNEYIPLKPLRPGGRTKDQRIKGLQPLYANQKFFHSRHVANIQHLEDELLRFPRGKHDDVVDALAYILDIPIYPPRRRVSRPKKQRYLYG